MAAPFPCLRMKQQSIKCHTTIQVFASAVHKKKAEWQSVHGLMNGSMKSVPHSQRVFGGTRTMTGFVLVVCDVLMLFYWLVYYVLLYYYSLITYISY